MTYKPRCPRCGHFIPNDFQPGEYMGAMSRYLVDDCRIIEICSPCGEDEAMMQFMEQGRVIPPSEWPLTERSYMNTEDYAAQREIIAELIKTKAEQEQKQ